LRKIADGALCPRHELCITCHRFDTAAKRRRSFAAGPTIGASDIASRRLLVAAHAPGRAGAASKRAAAKGDTTSDDDDKTSEALLTNAAALFICVAEATAAAPILSAVLDCAASELEVASGDVAGAGVLIGVTSPVVVFIYLLKYTLRCESDDQSRK